MGALKLLITGAGGYIGRHAVAEARARGHTVVALVRKTACPDWANDPGIDVMIGDLNTPGETLVHALHDVDCVVHCAAAMSGDEAAHQRDTLDATSALLQAMPKGGKIILLGSIAVYDMRAVAPDDLLNENTPLETRPEDRDTYAAAKLAQEGIAIEIAKDRALHLTILRAGAVFGPDRLWNAHIGMTLGPVLLRMESKGELPLCHISTCAQAMISAAEAPATTPINVLDEDLPGRQRYLDCLPNVARLILPLNWRFVLPLACALTAVGLNKRLPGLLRPAVLRARFLPVRYDNSRMREVLQIRQAHGFEALMHEAQT